MKQGRVAVLITCHNRKSQTLECLKKLFVQDCREEIFFDVYLTDDGSTDGTTKAIRTYFPNVILLRGDGNMFWCGGMRLAFAEASKKSYDYYLWLNDDTILFPHALQNLILTEASIKKKLGKNAIIVGSVGNFEKTRLTYGGSLMKKNRWQSIKFEYLYPSEIPKRCDVFNGNCVLIPRLIAESVGNIREGFMQGGGDRDYGIRAKKLGYTSWICPGYVGVCNENALLDAWKKQGLSFEERLKIVSHPARVHRIHDWMLFTRYYCKGIWPLFWMRAYLRLWFPWLWIILRLRTI